MEPVAATRWGDRRRADSDFAREQILDAACRCYERSGVSKTTMEHIAQDAKVTRTTIYRYFQTRDEVLTGVILRATQVMVQELQKRVANTRTFGDFVVEAAASTYELIPESPVLRLILREQTAVLHRLYVSSEEVLTMAVAFLHDRFDAAERAGELRPGVELPALTEWIVHIVCAYLLAPPNLNGPGSGLRQTLRQFLEPAVVRG